MNDVPILSSNELTKILHKQDPELTIETVNETIKAFSKIKGFGGLVEDTETDELIYFLTQPQLLMISNKFDFKVRWALIQALVTLTDDTDVMENVVKAAIDKRIHKYNENKSLIEIYRPLTNLLACCYDNEYFAATHYQFTHLYNRLNTCSLTGYQLKELMVAHGFLSANHRAIPGGRIVETAHYIEYADKSYDTVYSPIYREEDISLLITTLGKPNPEE